MIFTKREYKNFNLIVRNQGYIVVKVGNTRVFRLILIVRNRMIKTFEYQDVHPKYGINKLSQFRKRFSI